MDTLDTALNPFAARRLMFCAQAREAFAQAEATLAPLGTRLTLFGSVAKGLAKPGSDLDVMVLDRGRATEAQIYNALLDQIEDYGMGVDLIFSDQVSVETRERMLANVERSPAGLFLERA